MAEKDEQAMLFLWLRANKIRSCAVINERHMSRLARNPHAYLNSCKQVGWEEGVPDVWIFEPPPIDRTIRGIVIEMKFGKGKTTPEQEEWLEWLDNNGWQTAVHYSRDSAVRYLEALGYGR